MQKKNKAKLREYVKWDEYCFCFVFVASIGQCLLECLLQNRSNRVRNNQQQQHNLPLCQPNNNDSRNTNGKAEEDTFYYEYEGADGNE